MQISKPLRHHLTPPDSVRALRGEDTLGWGIVGASQVATRHMIDAIRAQVPIPVTGSRYDMMNATIVGIYSHDEAHARRVADAYQIPLPFVNLMDLVHHREIHCIYVGGHPRHHAEMILAALGAGKHVLCESPIALSVDSALSVTHTALNHGLQLGINYQTRVDAAIVGLRTRLMEGEIGDVLGGHFTNATLLTPSQQAWRLLGQGGGVVLDRMLHTLDLIRFLFQDEIARIFSTSTAQIFGEEVEEDVVSHISLKRSDLLLQLHDSYILPHVPSSIEIYGSSGVLIARNSLTPHTASELFLLRNHQISPLAIDLSLNPYVESVRRFQASVRHQEPILASGNDGAFSLIAGLAALESIRLGRSVTIDSLPLRPIHSSLRA